MKIIPKKRRLERKTNYSKRRKLLENSLARIVIRKSNKYILMQYVESKEAQDSVRLSVLSKELINYGWPADKIGSLKNLGACYLTGLLFGNKIKHLKIQKAVVDFGLHRSTRGSRIYASLNGLIDSGLKIPCDEKMFPSKERIKNKKSSGFFESVKENIVKGEKNKNGN
jgi:large subunit ribosomal protein L18